VKLVVFAPTNGWEKQKTNRRNKTKKKSQTPPRGEENGVRGGLWGTGHSPLGKNGAPNPRECKHQGGEIVAANKKQKNAIFVWFWGGT